MAQYIAVGGLFDVAVLVELFDQRLHRRLLRNTDAGTFLLGAHTCNHWTTSNLSYTPIKHVKRLLPGDEHLKIGYCRVSTSSGEQLSALEAQVARVEAAGVDRVITDVESGLSNEREGMNELLSLIDRKQVSEVVATRSRSAGPSTPQPPTL